MLCVNFLHKYSQSFLTCCISIIQIRFFYLGHKMFDCLSGYICAFIKIMILLNLDELLKKYWTKFYYALDELVIK